MTKIVMGRINHKQNPLTGKKSLADRLIALTDLDIYIIPDHQPLYKNRSESSTFLNRTLQGKTPASHWRL